MSYDEFRLEIEATEDGDRYRLRAESRWRTDPVSGSFVMPYEAAALIEIREQVEAAIYSSGSEAWGGGQASVVQEFGERLFNAVFADDIGEFFRQTVNRSTEDERRVRVRLVTDAPELISLPWECLYGLGDWLVRSPDTCLVRHVPNAKGGRGKDKVTEPLRVLGMVAHPNDRDDLDGNNERERIAAALGNVDPDRLTLHWTNGGTWSDLQIAMQVVKPHVFHFIGHGRYNERKGLGTLALEQEAGGETQYIDSEELKLLIKGNKDLRLVVLNACEGAKGDSRVGLSNTAAYLVQDTADAVLAMQWEIGDSAARQFAETFYRSLANDGAVDNALDQARVGMFMGDKSLEWAAPVLYMRSQDGILFAPDLDEAEAKPEQQFEMKPLLDPVPILAEPELSEPVDQVVAAPPQDEEQKGGAEPFVIRFNEAEGAGRYRLSAVSEADQSSVEDHIELDADALDHLLWSGATSVAGPVRRTDSTADDGSSSLIPLAQAAEEVGRQLEASLTNTAVGRHLLETLQGLDPQDGEQVMRLIIDTTEANDLARLPWEFLWNPQRGQHAVLDRQTPVIRQLDFGIQPSSPPEDLPLRLLVASAEAVNQPELKVNEEFAALNLELSGLEAGDLIEIDRLEHATIDSLSEALEDHRSHILHFIGHGDFSDGEGVLALESAENPGQTDLVFAEDLFVRFGNQLTHLQMVFLNSCMGATVSAKDPFSGIAQQMIKRGVPSVIAMQFPIPDTAAAKLSSDFYRYLAEGDPIDVALSRARARLYRKNRPASWGAPALYMRPWQGPLSLVGPESQPAKPSATAAAGVAAAIGGAAALAAATATPPAAEPIQAQATPSVSAPKSPYPATGSSPQPRFGAPIEKATLSEPSKSKLPLLLGTSAVFLIAALFGWSLFGAGDDDLGSASDATVVETASVTATSDPGGPTATVEAPQTTTSSATPQTTEGNGEEDPGGSNDSIVTVDVIDGQAPGRFDTYVDGELVEPDAPIVLEATALSVEVYVGSDADAPADADDRTDEPVAAATVPFDEGEATVVIENGPDGQPSVAVVDQAVEPFAPGTGRVDVRHGAVGADLEVTVKPGGRTRTLEAGGQVSIVVGVGNYRLEVVEPGVGVIDTVPLNVADGELVTVSLGGEVAAGPTVAIDRVTGLASAPDGVPTGNSGLLHSGLQIDQYALPVLPAQDGGVLRGQARRSSGPIDPSAPARPVAVSMDGIELQAPVSAVGVDSGSQFEVPAADQVGWYRFGSVPGEAGATVLAAHVDFEGQPGAFFDLRHAALGDVVEVTLDDGSIVAYQITSSELIERPDVPLDELFAKGGEEVLHLITCGGEFDPEARSYESNLVVTAQPVS